MLYITYCHMCSNAQITLEKKVAFKNHLHFHNVLIKTNLLYLFGDWKSRVNNKRASFLCVYFNMEGTAYVCVPLMTAIFSIPARCMEMIKGKMCTVVVTVNLAISRRKKMPGRALTFFLNIFPAPGLILINIHQHAPKLDHFL